MTSYSDAVAAHARQAAVEQRARLLAAIWVDATGPRRGALPRCLLEAAEPRPAPLDIYAAELISCPDGAWRVQRDQVGTHPGAALLEAPLLAAFLPALCRMLLGESLVLASMPLWWFGDRETRAVFTGGCRSFAIRDGLARESEAVPLRGLSVERRAHLQSAVDADPDRFVACLDLGAPMPVRRVICDTTRIGPSIYRCGPM